MMILKDLFMIKVGTLFSGGLAALEWAMKYEELEHEVVFACEWDKYARKQYLEFHGEPTSNFYEDVSDMDGTKYKDTIDLMCWGSPCQDLSLAGKRAGFDGAKSSLFREGARIQSEIMPKVFIFENVKGLLSSNKGADYAEVVKTFQDMGYLIQMKVLNAKEHGTAQNRERVFIVGFLDVDAYHAFSFEDGIPLTKTLRDYLDDEVEDKYYLKEQTIKRFEFVNSSGNQIGKIGGDVSKIHNSITNRIFSPYRLCPTLTTASTGGNQEVKILDFTNSFGEDKIREYIKFSPTLRGERSGLCTIENIKKWSLLPFRIRKLIPKEYGRLMGMRDEDINIVLSDTQAYKIFGNGIEINTIRSIVRGLYKPVKKLDTLF
jgi:DNA (cytosine-5)-methyltransferase 1